MAKYKYKESRINPRLLAKLFCLTVVIFGAAIFAYTFFPIISWKIYFAPAYAASQIDAPIPTLNVINSSNISSLIGSVAQNLNTDYTNAYNWYPGYQKGDKNEISYTISIPKINIKDALVNNKDADLAHHLVQFNSDVKPPKEGNAIIFGHSTLPQLYEPNNYKTIFANAYKLGVGDEILVNTNGKSYKYKVESVIVVDPSDTSVLAQNFSDSFLTIITCTPPGTIWKRLVIKSRIESL
jgi:sortase A